MNVPSLNKVGVTHRLYNELGVIWLLNQGYRLRVDGSSGRVYLVRSLWIACAGSFKATNPTQSFGRCAKSLQVQPYS